MTEVEGFVKNGKQDLLSSSKILEHPSLPQKIVKQKYRQNWTWYSTLHMLTCWWEGSVWRTVIDWIRIVNKRQDGGINYDLTVLFVSIHDQNNYSLSSFTWVNEIKFSFPLSYLFVISLPPLPPKWTVLYFMDLCFPLCSGLFPLLYAPIEKPETWLRDFDLSSLHWQV